MADAACTPGDPFTFHAAQTTRLTRAAIGAARPFFEAALGIPALRDLYVRSRGATGETFEGRILNALGVGFRLRAEHGARLPESGPLILASNHPTGALDGLILLELLRQVRPDVRILANYLLAAVPELSPSCFFIDPFGGPTGASRSRAGLRAAHLWLRSGGALAVFPAGEVSGAFTDRPVDGPWRDTVGRLALATGARVMPAWIEARNSRLFYAAGRVHPALRTLWLGREFLRQRGRTIDVRVGSAVSLDAGQGPPAVTALLRSASDALAGARPPDAAVEIAPAADPIRLAADIAALDANARLLSSGPYDVYCSAAGRIPAVLAEIGRLRELTFRAVGEGTGRDRDLDGFDQAYEHLFVWHRERREVVGAYRIGRSDRLLAAHGPAGLYTTTLFRYDARLLPRLSEGLELGRAFVRAEYQRTYNALLLLWKGIARYVVRHPHYRALYGPVSISNRYADRSQAMLRALLEQHHRDESLSGLADAVNPPAPLRLPAAEPVPASIEEVDTLVRATEADGQGVPVLLRQYLRLNARLLGFNVDPAFGGALDALMLVDLAALPEATLARYMGAEDARTFRRRHVPDEAQAAA